MTRFSTAIGGKLAVLFLVAACLWAGVGTARAGSVLWYNGDFDGNSAAYNAVVPSVQQAYVYDDFIVPVGQTWTIYGVYSNNLLDTTVSSAYYEIRSGVSSGNGGNLLFDVTYAATQTATGATGFGYDEYTVGISGLTGVTLSAGTYWLTVAPLVPNDMNISYITTTSGANAIGMPPGNDGDSYADGSYYSNGGATPFQPAGNFVTPLYTTPQNNGQPDFSMGVIGTAAVVVPEPSTFVSGMTTAALLAAGYVIRRRRRAE